MVYRLRVGRADRDQCAGGTAIHLRALAAGSRWEEKRGAENGIRTCDSQLGKASEAQEVTRGCTSFLAKGGSEQHEVRPDVSPVRVLEREVRAVDRGSLEAGAFVGDEDGAHGYPRATIRVHRSPDVAGRWWRAQQLARRVAGELLTR